MRRIGETHPDGLLSFVLGPNTHLRKTDAVAERDALYECGSRHSPRAALIISPPASAKAWHTVCAARRAIGRRVAEGWGWRSLPVGNAIGEVFTLENLLRVLPPSFRSFFFRWVKPKPLSGLFLKAGAKKKRTPLKSIFSTHTYRSFG